jgi:hypothetical protein
VTKTLDKTGVSALDNALASSARPVLLATLDAPLLEEACHTAVDTAVESGQPLLVVNAVEAALTRCALTFGHHYIGSPRIEESLNAPAALAQELGVHVERICLHSPRPVEALLERWVSSFSAPTRARCASVGTESARESSSSGRRLWSGFRRPVKLACQMLKRRCA